MNVNAIVAMMLQDGAALRAVNTENRIDYELWTSDDDHKIIDVSQGTGTAISMSCTIIRHVRNDSGKLLYKEYKKPKRSR